MPSKIYYIIDAFNLIHALGWAHQIAGPGNLHRARQRLVGELSNRLTADEQSRTTLVFDTSTAMDEKATLLSQQTSMHVLFSVDFDTADEHIVELLARHSAPRQVVVVSNDREVQRAAKRRQAEFQSCQSWFDWLETRGLTAQAEPEESSFDLDHPGKDSELSDADRDYWMREFGL